MQAVYDEYKKRSAASSSSWLGRATQNISETGQNLDESSKQNIAEVQKQMGEQTGVGAPSMPKDSFNPLPVEGAKTDLLDKVAQYGGPVGQAASGIAKSTLDNAEQGLKTVGQGVKTLGESSKITSGEDVAKNVEGIADIIGGGLSTVFAPLTAVTEKTPVVNTLFEKIGQGQDALSSFLADKIGTTDQEKIALQKSFNNLMNLGMIKYGPQVTEKAAPYVSDAATSLKGAVSDIAGDIKSSPLGKTASGFTNWTSEKLSGMTGKVRGSTESVIKSNLDGITKIENKLKPVSNFINDAKAKGIDVKQIVSETDLLKDAVDSDGNIKTMQSGGAVSQIKDAMKPAEGVVLKALEAEGKTMPLSAVADYMKSLIDQNSGLFGKAVDLAKSKVDAEIAGLAKYTDASGNIKLSDLQKFKVAKGKTINYSDPEAAIIEKDLVRGAKELIEQNTSSVDVKAINRELQTLYTVQEFLELLDNKKVQGARLGKYFAQTVGTVVGSAFGPLSAIMGGELSKFLYGKSMQGTFKGSTGGELGLSEQMKSAIDQSSKNEGSLNTNQSTTSINTITPIK